MCTQWLTQSIFHIRVAHHGTFGCNTVEYTMVFMHIFWLGAFSVAWYKLNMTFNWWSSLFSSPFFWMWSYCKTEFDFMHCWEFITISKHSLFQVTNVKFLSFSHFRPTPKDSSFLFAEFQRFYYFIYFTLNFVAQVVKFIQAIFINLVGSFGLSVSFLSLSVTLLHTENMNSNHPRMKKTLTSKWLSDNDHFIYIWVFTYS